MANENSPAAPAKTATGLTPKRKLILKRMALGFGIIGIIFLLYWIIWGRFREYTDDAYVAGNLVQLMPQISGTITTIYSDDTYLATEGQPLIKLDSADTTVALERARANLALTVRQVRQYYEDVKQAQANLILRQADLEKASLDFKRRTGLVGERAISREEMQHYLTAKEAAQAQYDAAKHKFTATLGLVENTTLYHHPMVERAKANFKNAYLNSVRTTIYAPVTGYIAKRNAQVGQQVTPGTALLAIVPLNDVWVEANYKESQLSRLRIGQEVEIIADANECKYHGKILGLGAGSGAAFALLPPQNATGNWIKIVQRVPVRITFDPKELREHPLQIGLSVRSTTFTRWLKGEMLQKTASTKPVYSTSIFATQLANANKEIDRILRENSPDVQLKPMSLPEEPNNGQAH